MTTTSYGQYLPRQQERPRASAATIVLLVLVAVLVVGVAVVIALLLSIRGDLGTWGTLLDGYFGYSPCGA